MGPYTLYALWRMGHMRDGMYRTLSGFGGFAPSRKPYTTHSPSCADLPAEARLGEWNVAHCLWAYAQALISEKCTHFLVQIFQQKHASMRGESSVSSNSVFYRMHRISDIYFVGGFGTVQWIDTAEYAAVKPDAIVMDDPYHTLEVRRLPRNTESALRVCSRQAWYHRHPTSRCGHAWKGGRERRSRREGVGRGSSVIGRSTRATVSAIRMAADQTKELAGVLAHN